MQIQRTVVQWHVTSGHVSLPVCPPACLPVCLSIRPTYLLIQPTYLSTRLHIIFRNQHILHYMSIYEDIEGAGAWSGSCCIRQLSHAEILDSRKYRLQTVFHELAARPKVSKL